jgi:putative transposase
MPYFVALFPTRGYHVNMVDIEYKRNCVYQLAYHVVWCTKYRKPILSGSILRRVNELICVICKDNHWVILSQEIQPDHIHLFLTFSPAISISTVIKKLKGIVARKLFIEFPELQAILCKGSLWSPSYYVGTAGSVSAEIIKKYIERSEHMRSRR